MGESLLETPEVENKMGESIAHVPCLQESVSFGRFEHDSLCWERWSTFPTNKYLEEVEKCSTPGSVAQKKAYFEAHYKKIAARKAELLDQEKKRESESVDLEDQSHNLMDSVCSSSEEDLEVESAKIHNPVNAPESEKEVVDFMEVNNMHSDATADDVNVIDEENEVANLTSEVGSVHNSVSSGTGVVAEESEVASFTTEVNEDIEEPTGDVDNIKDNKDLRHQPEDATEDLCSKKEFHESKLEEPDVMNVKNASALVPQDKEELPQGKVEEKVTASKGTRDALKLETPKKIQKATSVRRTTISSSAKKQPTSAILKGSASPIPKKFAATTPKSSILSTSKPLKSTLSKSATPTARPSVKKENSFTPLTGKKAARPEGKRLLPTSLYMSVSLGPANSDPAALATTRKSLIMESMGDKDIVKRAFKAFQNCNQLSPSTVSRSPATNQSLTKKTEQNGSSPVTLHKKTEGMLRSVKAASPFSGQQGTRKASLLPGSRKTAGVDQTKGKSIPSSFGSRSLNLGNNQKEVLSKVSEKLDQKSKTKEAGKAHLQSKAMFEKAAEIIRPRQSISSMAKLSSSCNHGRPSKVLLKGDA